MCAYIQIYVYIYTRTYMCVCECALISIRVCFGVFKAGITSYKQPLLTTTFLCCSSARRTIIITKAAYESWQHIVNTNTIGRGRAREHESRWASQSCQRQQPIGVNLHWQSREQRESKSLTKIKCSLKNMQEITTKILEYTKYAKSKLSTCHWELKLWEDWIKLSWLLYKNAIKSHITRIESVQKNQRQALKTKDQQSV